MPSYQSYPMVLNGVFLGMIGLRTDQISYFNIPVATPEELKLAEYTIGSTTFQKKIYSNRLDTATSNDSTTVKRKARTKKSSKDHIARGGRPIKIPTQLRSIPATQPTTDGGNTIIKPGSIRMTTIKFPGVADLAEISAWLHAKLVAKKPTYLKSPGGRVYPIAPFGAGNVVTGGDNAGNTTP